MQAQKNQTIYRLKKNSSGQIKKIKIRTFRYHRHTKSSKGRSGIYYMNICHSEHLQLFGQRFSIIALACSNINIEHLTKFQFLTVTTKSCCQFCVLFFASFVLFLEIFLLCKAPNQLGNCFYYEYVDNPSNIFASQQ